MICSDLFFSTKQIKNDPRISDCFAIHVQFARGAMDTSSYWTRIYADLRGSYPVLLPPHGPALRAETSWSGSHGKTLIGRSNRFRIIAALRAFPRDPDHDVLPNATHAEGAKPMPSPKHIGIRVNPRTSASKYSFSTLLKWWISCPAGKDFYIGSTDGDFSSVFICVYP
jgi:hypothetical protein